MITINSEAAFFYLGLSLQAYTKRNQTLLTTNLGGWLIKTAHGKKPALKLMSRYETGFPCLKPIFYSMATPLEDDNGDIGHMQAVVEYSVSK